MLFKNPLVARFVERTKLIHFVLNTGVIRKSCLRSWYRISVVWNNQLKSMSGKYNLAFLLLVCDRNMVLLWNLSRTALEWRAKDKWWNISGFESSLKRIEHQEENSNFPQPEKWCQLYLRGLLQKVSALRPSEIKPGTILLARKEGLDSSSLSKKAKEWGWRNRSSGCWRCDLKKKK